MTSREPLRRFAETRLSCAFINLSRALSPFPLLSIDSQVAYTTRRDRTPRMRHEEVKHARSLSGKSRLKGFATTIPSRIALLAQDSFGIEATTGNVDTRQRMRNHGGRQRRNFETDEAARTHGDALERNRRRKDARDDRSREKRRTEDFPIASSEEQQEKKLRQGEGEREREKKIPISE